MLRRAMDLGGFHQVIFICHMPLVLLLADEVLSVRGGCVVIGSQKDVSAELREEIAAPPPADYQRAALGMTVVRRSSRARRKSDW